MFPHRQDPKSGYNLCCHKLMTIISPCVLLVLPSACFPFNACSPLGGTKACLFGLVGLCLAVLLSVIYPKNYTVYSSVLGRKGIHCFLKDTKVAFTSNSRSPRRMKVSTRSYWWTTEAKMRAPSISQKQVTSNFQFMKNWESLGLVLQKVLSVNMTLCSVLIFFFFYYFPGYQAIMNELFRVIGESLNFTLTKQ